MNKKERETPPSRIEPPTPTPRRLRRFYSWLGLFVGAVAMALLSILLRRVLPDLPLLFYLCMSRLEVYSIVAIGVLLTLAAWKAAVFIQCEDHLLLALADKVRARREELERKEESHGQSEINPGNGARGNPRTR